MRTFRGRCTSAAAELLLIVVCVAGVLLARCPGGEPPKQAAVKSNNACYVCHMPFIEEPLAADHAKVHVWCGTCHGPSIAHVEDENIGATPPDTVFKKDRIDRMCGQCHDPEEHTPLSTKTRASHLAKSKQAQRKIKGRKVKVTGVCTDCHGHHWIPPREPDVDTKTGSQDRRQGGSSRSKLIAMHDAGHNKVELSREAKDKLAARIDLVIPFCGDYIEANAWNEGEMKQAQERMALREEMDAVERRSIAEMVEGEWKPGLLDMRATTMQAGSSAGTACFRASETILACMDESGYT